MTHVAFRLQTNGMAFRKAVQSVCNDRLLQSGGCRWGEAYLRIPCAMAPASKSTGRGCIVVVGRGNNMQHKAPKWINACSAVQQLA